MPEKGWRKKLYIIIFEADTKAGKIFDLVLLWAIILSVLAVILESDSVIRQNFGVSLKYLEWFFTIIFTIEYLLRIICVQRPLKYMTSFFGVVDFLAIAPTFLSFFVDGSHFFAVVRAVRLLRVFRILKLARYSQEAQVLLRALRASRPKIIVFLGAVLTVVLIMSTLMHLVERDNPGFSSIFKGMYWAVVTITTVGYGDIAPHTGLGKFFASILMIMGYGIIAVPTGIVSVELSNASREENEKNKCAQCKAALLSDKSKYCHQCGASVKPN